MGDIDEAAIFDIARQISTQEGRHSYLIQVCGADTALMARIEALLRVHDEEQGFLEASPAGLVPTADIPDITESAGNSIGRYKLMEQIGEGGMGVVFVAEQQEPLRRKVALKVIKPGMDSCSVIGRFEAERQALALMEHPNIARVLDAGQTDSGRPYFVMELVRGIPVTQYCDERRLSIPDRLELFINICQAIQHAHQKAIIHRDIKPSNVLVTEQDGKPVPKVIDFGVSKALNQSLTNRTVYTSFQSFIGTPLYASPEQASLSNVDVDTRSDVYSMGVLLYELLTGTTPFDKEQFEEAAFDEIRRILQVVEPAKPSMRISSLGETAATVSQARRTEPESLGKLVKGDLDWIVMKAMNKERARRYGTVSALAEDVLRHLSHEPVTARPPSYADRLRKFARRNKFVVSAAAAVAAVLLIGMASTSWQMVVAKQAERRLAEELYIADMSVARQAWGENNVTRVMEILNYYSDGCEYEHLRKFEWYYLWAQTRRGEDAPTMKMPRSVQSLSYSADSDRLLAVGHDGTVFRVDRRDETQVTLQPGKGGYYRTSGDLSADGSRAAYVKLDWHTIVVRGLDDDTNYEIKCDALLRIVRFVNNRSVAVSLASGFIEIIEIDRQERMRRRRFVEVNNTPAYMDLAISPLENCVAVGHGGNLYLWNLVDDTVRAIRQAHAPGLIMVEFAPDGEMIATGGVHGLVKIWDRESDVPVHTLVGHTHEIRGLSFSPDGTQLASSAKDGTVRLWDTQSGMEQDVLRGHGSDVASVVFVNGGRQCISSGHRCLKTWSVDPRYQVKQATRRWPGDSLKFCSDEELLVRNRYTNEVICIDVDTGEKEWSWETGYELAPAGWNSGHAYDLKRLAMSATENLGVIVAQSETLEVWNPRKGKKLYTLDNSGGIITQVELSNDNDLLAIGKDTGAVSVFSLNERELLATIPAGESEIRVLAFSHDNSFLSAASDDGNVYVCHPRTGELINVLKTRSDLVTALACSPISDDLAVGAWDGTIRIWNVMSGAVVGTLNGHRGIVRTVSYSAEGKSIYSAGEDKTIKIWDVKHQRERFALTGSPRAVRALALSPNGRNLASVTWDGVVAFWRAASDEAMRNERE